MKTKIIIALLALASTLNAADVLKAPPPAAKTSWSDSIGLDAVAIARGKDFRDVDYSGGLRLSYDLTARLGLVLEAEGRDAHGVLVDSTFAGVKFALPLGKTIRPYLLGGVGLKFPHHDEYAAGGAGLEYARGAWRIFAEAMAEKSRSSDATFRVTSGIGFRF